MALGLLFIEPLRVHLMPTDANQFAAWKARKPPAKKQNSPLEHQPKLQAVIVAFRIISSASVSVGSFRNRAAAAPSGEANSRRGRKWKSVSASVQRRAWPQARMTMLREILGRQGPSLKMRVFGGSQVYTRAQWAFYSTPGPVKSRAKYKIATGQTGAIKNRI